MLTPYRLHTRACSKGRKRGNREKQDCDCMFHVEGMLNGKMLRRSARTRSLSKVKAAIQYAEKTGLWRGVDAESADASALDAHRVPATVTSMDENGHITLKTATERFIAKLESQSGGNLESGSVSKYTTALTRLQTFCERVRENPDGAKESPNTLMSEIDEKVLLAFQDTWVTFKKGKGIGPQTTGNYITRLRKFGKLAVKRGWWKRNFALDLDYPLNYTRTERLPFDDETMERILEAARTIVLDRQQEIDNFELETFILVMRHVGMSICDATLLQKSEVIGDEVHYFRHKTRRHANRKLVIVPIPDWLLERLKRLEKQRGLFDGKYYFCHGSHLLVSAVSSWHKRLQKVFKAVGIAREESHRFRHTFATYWLNVVVELPGGQYGYIPVSMVAGWLGHSSEKTTIKYYQHVMKDRQQATSNIMRTHFREQKNEETARLAKAG